MFFLLPAKLNGSLRAGAHAGTAIVAAALIRPCAHLAFTLAGIAAIAGRCLEKAENRHPLEELNGSAQRTGKPAPEI